jgi:conjugal transfer pilus assembly protein TraE
MKNYTSMEKLERRLDISLLLNVGLAIVLLILSFVNITAHQRERIVIVPPGLTGPTPINWSVADETYLKNYALYFTMAFVQVNPRNVQHLIESLTTFVDPSIYSEMLNVVHTRAKNPFFHTSGTSILFEPTAPMVFESETETVFIPGNEIVTTGLGKANPKNVVYEVRVRMIAGKPVIYGFKSYSGSVIHNKEWKEAHPEEQDK